MQLGGRVSPGKLCVRERGASAPTSQRATPPGPGDTRNATISQPPRTSRAGDSQEDLFGRQRGDRHLENFPFLPLKGMSLALLSSSRHWPCSKWKHKEEPQLDFYLCLALS